MASPLRITGSAPGRVNLIGEHLDYNGGRCLPIALPHRTRATVRTRPDGALQVRSDAPADARAYVRGVLRALDVPSGLEVQLGSDVPIGAGLSSSAALECAVAVAVDALHHLGRSRAELVEACIRAETEYVGAPTGGLDQTVAMFAQAGHALLVDFATGAHRQVPFTPAAEGVTLLVVDTRVSHALVEGGYGDRRREAEAARDRLGVARLTAADLGQIGELAEPLARRARHVVTEQARVDTFVEACAEHDWARCGEVLNAGHASLREDYEVSSPELDVVVETAVDRGALGARMTGGGFGGSAIALVPAQHLDAVRRAVTDAFTARGWRAPGLFEVEASDAAGVDDGF